MKKVLVEGLYGHGSISCNYFIRKIKRWYRGKYKTERIGAIAVVDWTQPYSSPYLGIKNQQQSSSCGGMAGSYFIEIQRLLQNIKEPQCSAKSMYSLIACYGGGTTENSLEGQIAGSGANLETVVPDTAPDGTCTEEFMTDKSWITTPLLENAITRAGYTPLSVNMDIDSIAQAIKNEGAVIFVVKGQNNGTWLSYTPQPPSNENTQPLWEHFVCAFGYQLENGIKKILFLNSWGASVGQNGVQSFNENYINNGIVDCFTFVVDSKIKPVSGNNSLWAYLWAYFTGNKLQLSPSQ